MEKKSLLVEEEFFENSILMNAYINRAGTILYKWTHTYALMAKAIKGI